MKHILHVGETVHHRKRKKWGVGKITSVNSCGTALVVFEGNKTVSIAKAINYLVKVDIEGSVVGK